MAEIAIYPVTLAQRDETYSVSMSKDREIAIGMEESIQIIHADTYQGDYVVIPKADEETILETRDKTLTDNVTVTKVPFFETHSDTGTTVFIASEV